MVYYFGYYKSKYIEDYAPNGSINAISFKMGYIIKKIKEAGYDLTVISSYISDKNGYCPFKKVVVDKKQTDYYLPTLRLQGAFSKLTGAFRLLSMIVYLFLIVKRNSTIIVYHFPDFSPIFIMLKKIKKLKVILEVEEIFYRNNKSTDAMKTKVREERMFHYADGYIVVNDLIYKKYLDNTKKHIVVYGSYDLKDVEYPRCKDGKIHVLFSGSIDKVRGAFLAVSVAKYLPQNYCLHMTGSGTQENVKALVSQIVCSNSKENHCQIIYHGQLSDDELNKLACSCAIGLNLQDVENPFEEVSFPSKITFYLLHGLNVISTRMSSVMASRLKNCVEFAESNPEDVAKTIKNLQLRTGEENRSCVLQMNQELKEELQWLIE